MEDDLANVDNDQLRAFWQQLPAHERPALCRVPIEDFERNVLQRASAGSSATRAREAAAREGANGRAAAAAEPDSSAGTADTLLMRLCAAFTGQGAAEREGAARGARFALSAAEEFVVLGCDGFWTRRGGGGAAAPPAAAVAPL